MSESFDPLSNSISTYSPSARPTRFVIYTATGPPQTCVRPQPNSDTFRLTVATTTVAPKQRMLVPRLQLQPNSDPFRSTVASATTAAPTPLTPKHHVLASKPVAAIRPSLTSTLYRKRENPLLLVNLSIYPRAEK
jgi:hypothetical protein